MKLALTNLTKKTVAVGITTSLILGLSGCGNAERHNARQKFKEAVAAIKVRTQGSTYAEFRQAELELKTSYQANKTYLDDVKDQFAGLDALMTATDVCWSYSINNARNYVDPRANWQIKQWQAMQFLSPEKTEKLNSIVGDQPLAERPDYFPKNYVKMGLTKISDQADGILNLLEK